MEIDLIKNNYSIFKGLLEKSPSSLSSARVDRLLLDLNHQNPLQQEESFLKAVKNLLKVSEIIISIGFPVAISSNLYKNKWGRLSPQNVQLETDGEAGLYFGSVLQKIGKNVVFVVEESFQPIWRKAASNYSLTFEQAEIDSLNPKLLVAIEKPGHNSQGVAHNMRGYDITPYCLDLSDFVNSVPFSIGIGDGGNEIGMGNILHLVNKYIPEGINCQCGCKGGITSNIKTSVLLITRVSNCGAYALALGLSLALQDLSILPSTSSILASINQLNSLGVVEGISGQRIPFIDGVHVNHYVESLQTATNMVRSVI